MPHGIGARYYEQVPSTNALAKDIASSGEKGPVWLVAGKQSAGRGRQGRRWVSKAGNLYCSLLFTPNLKPSDLFPLPFLVSLAVCNTFIELGAKAEAVKCKWPNDVLINNKKASGILIESALSSNGDIEYLVIGIGMNLQHHPEEALFPATSFKEQTGKDVKVKDAISALADKLKDEFEVWQTGHFSPIRDAWHKVAWGIGEKREFRTNTESYRGIFNGLDEQGAAHVILDDGTEKTLYVADIFPNCG